MSTLGHLRPELERVLEDIRFKRERQQNVHGWTIDHDDEHDAGELASAAIPYIQAGYNDRFGLLMEELQVFWPWPETPFDPKSSDTRRDFLINAAALLVAELERLDRKGA